MLDEPFGEIPERDTWGYRLMDVLLYLLGTLSWLALLSIGIIAVLFEGSKVQVEPEWER
ncbi:MAG: hypothetical protein HYY30_13195 [Chloroflexi bacterium]|nr:hypothetical protein [Chloroflexota bacterium]